MTTIARVIPIRPPTKEEVEDALWDRLAIALPGVEAIADETGQPVPVEPASCIAGTFRMAPGGNWQMYDGSAWAPVDLGIVRAHASLRYLVDAMEDVLRVHEADNTSVGTSP